MHSVEISSGPFILQLLYFFPFWKDLQYQWLRLELELLLELFAKRFRCVNQIALRLMDHAIPVFMRKFIIFKKEAKVFIFLNDRETQQTDWHLNVKW